MIERWLCSLRYDFTPIKTIDTAEVQSDDSARDGEKGGTTFSHVTPSM